MKKTQRTRKIVLIVLVAIIIVSSVLITLKVDFDNHERLFQDVIRENPDTMETFQRLKDITPANAVILSWWDYGRAIKEIGERQAVIAYPSRDIFQTVSASQHPIYAFEMQIFGAYEPSEKIHDVARVFLLPEDESLAIMEEYGVTHVMVFQGEDELSGFNDLWKFHWIAATAGCNATDYLTANSTWPEPGFTLTSRSGQTTILRLLFDERLPPLHFTKIHENRVAKVYRVDYSS